MTLRLYFHPFSSFCQKVLTALYERHVPFEPVVVNLGDPDAALQAHIWDRFFDLYVAQPMQERVKDCFRPEDGKDPIGVEEAKAQLAKTYSILDAHLADRGGDWVTGEPFTLADCGAGPALFYANIVQPFAGRPQLEAYYARLLARPSFARAVEEARPYRSFFPLPWPESYA